MKHPKRHHLRMFFSEQRCALLESSRASLLVPIRPLAYVFVELVFAELPSIGQPAKTRVFKGLSGFPLRGRSAASLTYMRLSQEVYCGSTPKNTALWVSGRRPAERGRAQGSNIAFLQFRKRGDLTSYIFRLLSD